MGLGLGLGFFFYFSTPKKIRATPPQRMQVQRRLVHPPFSISYQGVPAGAHFYSWVKKDAVRGSGFPTT